MKRPLIISFIIHVFFLIVATIGMYNPFSKKLEDKGYAVFEFKEIGPKSKAPIISQNEGHVSKSKAQKREKEENPAVKQTKEVEKAPKKEEPKKDEKPVPIDNKKKEKPKEKKESKKTKADEKKDAKKVDKSVVNLKKNKKSSDKADKDAKKKSFDSVLDDVIATDDSENTGVKAEEVGFALTATQIDLIRQTIRKCWHFPAGLKNAEDLSVDIKMQLSEEGVVTKADIVDKSRMNSDPNFKIAAENAYRAVLDPECSPLPLPKDKYDEWKDIEISFNPKEMFE